jgi:hypothetical protein
MRGKCSGDDIVGRSTDDIIMVSSALPKIPTAKSIHTHLGLAIP